ncbi:CTP-dependent diacylglycerol kinase 1 [Acrodontium crateriforme]|uniref:CTP-dependent diacylglycerol kinase 1 n=1 Tax=Acrodontium crateriforme TaxID=150365 RepID=A0AAQ3M378_9PEZI|nr:CTP-dependent diacylglycerol kinase 1 [Acrodontium crateriforme]
MASQHNEIPAMPRVISPSPTPSEAGGKDGYFESRSKTRRVGSVDPIGEGHEEDPELSRARSRSRSPQFERKPTRLTNGSTTSGAKTSNVVAKELRRRQGVDTTQIPNGEAHDFLSPASASTQGQGFGAAYWRNLSRSPSPFGLIPIHREWRTFVHKHEVPRKVLHVSIGFLALWLYYEDVQTSTIHPILLTLLVPIFATDVIRFKFPGVNKFYIRCLGPFMRESEAHDRFNGVIMYLAGVWATMRYCRKDVAMMSVLLLSWCDTAASTFGRAFGKYTPRIRKGKSLAGSIAAFTFGVGSAALFWGFVEPFCTGTHNDGVNSFAFTGSLTLPSQARAILGVTEEQGTITGSLALGTLSIVSGLVASVSEAFDLWGLDDNLTIPIFSGIGLGTILWALDGHL